MNAELTFPQDKSGKEDVEAPAATMEPPTTCCTSCKAAASAEKLEALEKQIEEIKTEMKAQHLSTQHDGPASMVFDAVFSAPVVGASDVDMKGDSEELKKAVADVSTLCLNKMYLPIG